MFKMLIRFILGFVLLLFLTFCSDSIVESTPSIDEDTDPIEVAPTFSEIQNNIFNQSCAFSGCHISGSINPNLSANSYSNIVNKQSSKGMNYIEPNDPDNSYLLQKVLGSSVISGSRMPLNSSSISQEKIDALIEWINNGAKND